MGSSRGLRRRNRGSSRSRDAGSDTAEPDGVRTGEPPRPCTGVEACGDSEQRASHGVPKKRGEAGETAGEADEKSMQRAAEGTLKLSRVAG